MEKNKYHCQKVAFTWSLIFATLGLHSAFLLITLLGGTGVVWDIPMPIIIGVIALYSAAACFGILAGYLIYRLKGQGFGMWLIGVGLAWICLFISCLAGSSVEFLHSRGHWRDFGDYIVKPLFWVMFFGVIPALLLGLAYTVTVKKRLNL